MRTKKVPGLEIKVPSGNAFAFNTDPMMFKSHQSCLVIGKRGSGKSVIAVNIIERMKYDCTVYFRAMAGVYYCTVYFRRNSM